jgi:hypothetical protein
MSTKKRSNWWLWAVLLLILLTIDGVVIKGMV